MLVRVLGCASLDAEACHEADRQLASEGQARWIGPERKKKKSISGRLGSTIAAAADHMTQP
jgi:hypothetical protein